MDTASQVLLIIVSATLTIFLIACLVLVLRVIALLKQLRQLTEHVEHIAGKAESVTDFLAAASGPVALAKLVASVAESFSRHKKHKDKK